MSAPHVIVGTAGHIDHGKTSLIRRLTGVDTDRLPEEKKRGITIVLGFAPLILPDGRRVGVVDVPGHERFVKNMVAGAGGIDVVLMVVAADEGVMPQTREHLEICQLLGIRRGLVAVTKIDRAGELAELAVEDVRSEFEGTFLGDAPIIPCSSETGEGIEEVKSELSRLVQAVESREQKSLLLPVDRKFSVKGFGTIITGTLIRGRIAVGDTVDVLPPVPGRAIDGARVRTLQVFGDSVEEAFAGQRTAVNLQGVDLESLELGQVLVSRGTAKPTKKLGARVEHLASRGKKLKSGAKFLLHTGTALVEAAMTLLDADALEPGESGFATIRLREPIATLPGQRFIARGFEATAKAGHTIAGGTVLDPDPGRRRRKVDRTLGVMKTLDALVEEGPGEERLENAVAALVKERAARGLTLEALARRLGFNRARIDKVIKKDKRVLVAGERAVEDGAVERLSERVLATIKAFHKEFPYRGGMASAELATRLKSDAKIVDLAATRLIAKKSLARSKEGLRAASFKPAAEANPEARAKLIETLQSAGIEPPAPAELEKACGLSSKELKELLGALGRAQEVVSASPTIHFAKSVWDDATAKVLAFIEKEGGITTAQAKELFGISRKYLIPLMEAMDKRKVTVRVGEVRKAKRAQ